MDVIFDYVFVINNDLINFSFIVGFRVNNVTADHDTGLEKFLRFYCYKLFIHYVNL